MPELSDNTKKKLKANVHFCNKDKNPIEKKPDRLYNINYRQMLTESAILIILRRLYDVQDFTDS